MYKQNIKYQLPILNIDDSINSIDFIINYKRFLEFKACYKYSFIINLDMPFSDIELFVEKIKILIEPNGIFYCNNPSQLLIDNMRANSHLYQPYQLISNNESINNLIKNNGFKKFILKHFFRLANVDIVDPLYFDYPKLVLITIPIQKQYPIFLSSNLNNLFNQLLDEARKNSKLSLQEIYKLLNSNFETLYYKPQFPTEGFGRLTVL